MMGIMIPCSSSVLLARIQTMCLKIEVGGMWPVVPKAYLYPQGPRKKKLDRKGTVVPSESSGVGHFKAIQEPCMF